MVLDARARVICNLGPVISGSLSDDYAQDTGVITTTGELVLAGLITARPGDQVQLGYITPDGTQAVRFPRSRLRVIKCFANPLTNQTSLEIGDELAYKKNFKGGTIPSELLDVVNGRAPGTGLSIKLSEAVDLVSGRLGLTIQPFELTIAKDASALDVSQGYLKFLSDAFVSEGKILFQQQDGTIQVSEIEPESLEGPAINISSLIDLAQTDVGEEPADVAKGSGGASKLKKKNDLPNESPTFELPEGEEIDPVNPVVGIGGSIPEELTTLPNTESVSLPLTLSADPAVDNSAAEGYKLNLASSWTTSVTESTGVLRISGSAGQLIPLQVTEKNVTAEETAGPDNRVVKRFSTTTTALAKVNQQLVEDIYRSSGEILDGPYTTGKIEEFTYEELQPEGLSASEKAQIDNEIRNASYAANPEELQFLVYKPKFRLTRKSESSIISFAEAAGRLGVRDYNRTSGIPGGSGYSEFVETEYVYNGSQVKEVRRIFKAYGLTQSGQQAISKALQKASSPVNLSPFISRFFGLVLDDVQVIIRTSDQVESGIQLPSTVTSQNIERTPTPVQASVEQRIKDPALSEVDQVIEEDFIVPFLPDDVIDEATGEIVEADPESKAGGFAGTQNKLRIGQRYGLQVTAPLGVLPTKPLAVFHLRNNDVMATYRINGTSWAFDANSCLVSTDALYVGAAGGDVNGQRWVPLPPGTSQLPAMPAVTNNGAQPLANAVELETLPDLSDAEEIAALLDSLPDDEDQTFELTAAPVATLPPFKQSIPLTLQAVAQLAVKYIPGGANKQMGTVVSTIKAETMAMMVMQTQIRLELITSERVSMIESFSVGLGLGGNLS